MKRQNIKEIIANYFYQNPTAKARVRQIERELKLPLPSVIRYTKELETEKILQTLEISKTKFYTADRTSENYLFQKKLYNLKMIHSSGLLNYLKEEYGNPCIILFGSYSKGEDTEKSDVDIYIETIKKTQNLEQFEKKLQRKIQLFIHKNINEIKNKQLANNILNGTILNGYVEVFK